MMKRRGGQAVRQTARTEQRILDIAWGTEHESIVRPPMRPRTMDQVRMYRKPHAKNITHTFRRNGKVRIV
mgnify:FL=1